MDSLWHWYGVMLKGNYKEKVEKHFYYLKNQTHKRFEGGW